MNGGLVECPGCGASLPGSGAEGPQGFRASGECRQRYDELAASTLGLRDPAFPHQHAVDAYAAQHASDAMKPITLSFALVGLHLACDRRFSGREVQRVHMLLARQRRNWPAFPVPERRGRITVADVVAAEAGEKRQAKLLEWACAVWAGWREMPGVRETIAGWLA